VAWIIPRLPIDLGVDFIKPGRGGPRVFSDFLSPAYSLFPDP